VSILSFLLHSPAATLVLHSFPTRRSSDLMLSLMVMVPLTVILFGPFGTYIGGAISTGILWLIDASGLISGVILGNSSSDICTKRSEEHTSELQSRFDLVCRLLLEKKNIID